MKIKIFTLLFLISLSISAQCFLTRVEGNMVLHNSSGNNQLDQILFNQKGNMENFFDLNIKFLFGTELSYSGNAFFSPLCNSFNCDGKIVVGKVLMQELANRSNSYVRLVAVIAHEFGHALQYKYGWNQNSKWNELHADYLAGYYIGCINTITESEFYSVAHEFASRGDDLNFYSSDPHGTPEERSCAFIEGFKFAKTGANIYSAYNAGKNYVFSNNPCNKNPLNSNRYNYYYPRGIGYQYFGCYVAAAVVLLSNDIYFRPTYSFYRDGRSDTISYNVGKGFSFGLRKQFNRSALEYGFCILNFEPKDQNIYNSKKSVAYGNLNYVHDLNIKSIPNRIHPYVGGAINFGSGIGAAGILGFYMPFLDRLKFDVRYEIGNRTNQMQFGLIYKYQKEYYWNKR
ncbi:MAG: hypothetical protein ACK5D5_05220 [Bacteroidota bacterium]|jgi:hypothetical protein